MSAGDNRVSRAKAGFPVHALCVLASLLLSWLAVIQDDIFNPDGLFYLRDARDLLQLGAGVAMQGLGWPLYSMLIAFVSGVSGLELVSAAHVVNAALDAGTVLALLRIVLLLNGDRANPWLLLLFVVSITVLNEYRSYLVRDHGYWCFALWGVYFLLRYIHAPRWRYAIGWLAVMAIAFLFRLEGIVLLAFAPLVLLRMCERESRKMVVLRFYGPCVVIGVAGAVLVILAGLADTSDLGRLPHLLSYIDPSRLLTGWNESVVRLQSDFLPEWATSDADKFLFGGVLGVVALQILSSTGLALVMVLLVCRTRLALLPRRELLVVGWFGLLSVGTLLVFCSQYLFLSGRYVTFSVLLIAILAGSALVAFADARDQGSKWPVAALCLLLTLALLDGVVRSGKGSKAYVLEAASWVQQLPQPELQVVTNHYYLQYAMDWQADLREQALPEDVLAEQSAERGRKLYLWYFRDEGEFRALRDKVHVPLNLEREFLSQDGDRSVVAFRAG